MDARFFLIALILLAACASGRTGDSSGGGGRRLARLDAFRAARDAGDLEEARSYLSDDPRVWYGKKEGEGSPWAPGQGRWRTWDTFFNGVSTPDAAWRLDGDAAWANMTETNDYFRLTEREDPPRYRITYFFGDDDSITGYLISPVPGEEGRPRKTRRAEFEAWARQHAPEEAEYLMPGGEIDPTGDRAQRMKALLLRWRAASGLEPSPPGPSSPPGL